MTTPVITIFVRHGMKDGKPCKYAGDEFSRRCKCPKHLRWTQGGKQYRRKAGTRSWEEAERVKRQLQNHLSGERSKDETRNDERSYSRRSNSSRHKKLQGVSRGTLSRYPWRVLAVFARTAHA